MKKILTFILTAVMLTGLFASCAKEEGVPAGFKRASNEVCDFDFFVPETWTVSQSSGTVAAYCSPTDPSSISVMPGELEHADSTVDDWWNTHKADFQHVYSDFTMISETEAILGGIKGKTYTFTGTLADRKLNLSDGETERELTSSLLTGGEVMTEEEVQDAIEETPVTYYFSITAVVKHSRVYMLTFTSTDELYENHTETLASVIENFKFH